MPFRTILTIYATETDLPVTKEHKATEKVFIPKNKLLPKMRTDLYGKIHAV